MNMKQAVENTPTNVDGFAQNNVNKEATAQHDFPPRYASLEVVREFCQKHYKQLLPFMGKEPKKKN